MFQKIALLFTTSLMLYGCATNTQQIASKHGFKAEHINTGSFKLASFQKIQKPGSDVNIYIEGDGRAWVSKYRISSDPSPRTPTTIKLAALDPHPNVVYLARPCQYSPQDLKTVCEEKYWTFARYSETVVSAIDSAISYIKILSNAPSINLIGYSGGGALAVLTAARRSDVASIRTVAGNLDLQEMDRIHDTTPLHESLDPLAVATKIKNIPQLHFVGGKDRVVPEIVAQNFVTAAGLDLAKVVIIKNATHNSGWEKQWLELLKLD